ncbi:hypothetical protein O181_111206 [Austropuccinia psidii MF-1]|uniref:Uncharacterized protein n=1 Tax=Austropuccinia psidii MF-1 TaxID=1389203 RepID=A0A9Q3PSH1_9BASI|nr:hypothetical protein [Austropuccinia psidii MF-1]
METPLKRKTNIPGVYIEDEEGTVEKTITTTKYKKPQDLKEEDEVNSELKEKNYGKEKKLTKNTVKNKDIKQYNTEAQEAMNQIIKKVLDQK